MLLALGVLTLFATVTPVPFGPVAGPKPAGAVATALRRAHLIHQGLGTVHNGDGPGEAFSSPAVADINGNGGVPEIVVAAMDGTVTAYSGTTFAPLWRKSVGATGIQSSPAIGQIGGTSPPDVVVGTMDGRVVVLNGPNGDVLRTYREGAPLHCPAGVDCRPSGFFATPALADVDGDGSLDIVAASYDHTVYAWRASGSLIFRRYLEDSLWSSPVVADIDGNGTAEIILGGDIWAGNPFGVEQGGLLWVLKRDGSTYPGYPRSIPGQTVWSTPAVADLNGDGALDIVFGTGNHGPFGDAVGGRQRRVYAVTARTGRDLAGWPVTTDGRVTNAVAVADVDGDLAKEAVFSSEGGWVYAYEANGARKWRACNAVTQSRCRSTVPNYPTHGTPVVADVDDDGNAEVISAVDKDMRVYNGSNGSMEAEMRLNGAATLAPASAPTVAEVNGKTLIVQQAVFSRPGNDELQIHVFTTDRRLCRAEWPAFKRGPSRVGALRVRAVPWVPFSSARSFLDRQYQDFLGRPADEAGVSFWTCLMNRGWTGAAVVDSFMASAEFGRVVAPMVRLYHGFTGKPPSNLASFRARVDRYDAGVSLDTIAAEMAIWPAQPADVDTFIETTFRRVQGAGYVLTEAALASHRSLVQQQGRGAWMVDRTNAASAVALLTPHSYVSMAYIGMLNRVPDQAGYGYWLGRVQNGDSIQTLIHQFQHSAEYRRRVT